MVATIGYFDGVHLGHQQVLKRLVDVAVAAGEKSMVITFAEHPKRGMPLLSTLQERKERILACGVDVVDVLDFPSIRHMTAREFIHSVLRGLHVTTLLMGYDHRFGSDQMSDFRTYQAIGEMEGVKILCLPQYAFEGKRVSSSIIRSMIEFGDIDEANRMLGYEYSMSGRVVGGRQIGRQIGFPTANLEIPTFNKVVAGTGVYVVDVECGKWDGRLRGMLNIGNNPTVGGSDNTIEVNLFDYSDNLYDETLRLVFLHRLRGEMLFYTIDDLKRQLECDRIAARNFRREAEV